MANPASDITEYIAGEFAAVGEAPMLFLISMVLASGLVWKAVSWHFETRLANADSTKELLQRQIDDYKDKLSGATPDAARAKIEALEARVDALSPRSLPADAQNAMVPFLDPFRGQLIEISSDSTSADASRLARQLQVPFNSAGWNVNLPTVMGIGRPPPSGVGLIVENTNQLSPVQVAISNALRAAGITFDLQQGRMRGAPPHIGEMHPAAEILISNPF